MGSVHAGAARRDGEKGHRLPVLAARAEPTLLFHLPDASLFGSVTVSAGEGAGMVLCTGVGARRRLRIWAPTVPSSAKQLLETKQLIWEASPGMNHVALSFKAFPAIPPLILRGPMPYVPLFTLSAAFLELFLFLGKYRHTFPSK